MNVMFRYIGLAVAVFAFPCIASAHRAVDQVADALTHQGE